VFGTSTEIDPSILSLRTQEELKGLAVAPAKVILAGEHFVVYGAPAIVAAVNMHSKATVSRRNDRTIVVRSSSPRCAISVTGARSRALQGGKKARTMLEPVYHVARAALRQFGGEEKGLNVQIDSAIPVGVGLGSSAAVSVSAIAATAKLLRRGLDRRAIRSLAFESERLIHDIPSGIDQTVSAFGGVIAYRREKPFRQVSLKRPFRIIIGNTGETRSTGAMVSRVRIFLSNRSSLQRQMMKSAERISGNVLLALERGDRRKLGELMNQNHELLRRIGASTEELDRLVSTAREAGAFGAKLTGAGGGGCMIAVAPTTATRNVLEAIRGAGGTPYLVSVEREGVRSWLLR